MADTGTTWKLLEAREGAPPGTRVVTVTNQKGGVAKTTTAINLSAALALRGHKVLLIDLDPQGNATTGVGLDRTAPGLSTYDVLAGTATLEQATRTTRVRNLGCIPASLDLAGAEVELATADERERRLADALREVGDAYDAILIDCPPSLGLLTVNALTAAHDLLVPVQAEFYALEGLGQLVGTAERVRAGVNQQLRIAGVLLTMYDARTRLAGQVAQEVRDHFGDLVFSTVIPRSVRLSEAPSFGEPVVTLDPASRGALAYRMLAAEFEERFDLATHVPPPPPRPSPVPAGAPGPHGRGYGTVAPEPPGLDSSWPPAQPWEVTT